MSTRTQLSILALSLVAMTNALEPGLTKDFKDWIDKNGYSS
jgi:hypothetical protein